MIFKFAFNVCVLVNPAPLPWWRGSLYVEKVLVANENHSHIGWVTMHLIVVSSLSLWARQAALTSLRRMHPTVRVLQLDADTVTPDDTANTTDPYVTITRRALSADGKTSTTTNRYSTTCTSCATHTDLKTYIGAGTGTLIIALPPGVSLANAVRLQKIPGVYLTSGILALNLADLEDDLWDSTSLTTRGVTGSCIDERTPGEYIITELAHADTVFTTDITELGTDPDTTERARDLLTHLAPHAVITDANGRACHCGEHSTEQVEARTEPGHLGECVPGIHRLVSGAQSCASHRHGASFTTAVLTTDRLVDTDLLAQHLPTIVEGACRVRGHVWLSDHPDDRVAIEGIGPTVWLQTCGSWGQSTPPRTIIAITGDDVNPAELQALLDFCTISTEALADRLLDAL